MTAREKEYQKIEIWYTAIYCTISLLAVGWVTMILNQVSDFTRRDLETALVVLPILLSIVGALQYFANRREMKPLRLWFKEEKPDQAMTRTALISLLRLPIRIASLTGGIWLITVFSFNLALAVFADTPAIRIAQCVLSISSAGLIAYVFQYNLFRVITRRILSQYPVFKSVNVDASERFGSIRYKYITLYGALLASCLMASSILSYSISRRAVVQNVIDEVANVMALAREQHEQPGYQNVWRNIERGIGVRISIQNTDEAVVPLKKFYDEPILWHFGISYAPIERQDLPLVLAVSEALPGQKMLVVERSTEFLQAQLTKLLLQVLVVYASVFFMGCGLLFVFVSDFFRPIWQITEFFSSSSLETLPVPKVRYSDDEAGLLNVQIVWLMRRMNKAVKELKDSFWKIRDGKRSIRVSISKQQQETADSVRDNEQFYRSLGRIRNQLAPVAANLAELGQHGALVNTSLLKINETMTSIHSFSCDLSDGVKSLGVIMERYLVSAEENGGLAVSGQQAFDLTYNGIRQLEDLASTMHDHLQKLSESDEKKCQYVSEQSRLVTAMDQSTRDFVDEYHDTLEETRELFREFGMITEAVQGLEEVKEQTDILGFQTTIVSSQSAGFQREFSVVADEMKDLAERTGSASGAALLTLHALTVLASDTLKQFVQSEDDFRKLSEHIVHIQNDQERGQDIQKNWEIAVRRLNDVLRFIDNDVESAQAFLEENRQKMNRSRNVFDEGRTVGVEANLMISKMTEYSTNALRLIEGQQRQFAKISETMPKVQDNLFNLGRHGSRIAEISGSLEDLLKSGEELVRNSNLHLQSIISVFDAADDVLDESEQKVRQISRFV